MIYEGPIKVFDYEDQMHINRSLRDTGRAISKDQGKRSLSFKIAKYLSISKIGDIIDAVNILLSICMFVIHAVDSDATLTDQQIKILRVDLHLAH